MFYFYQPLLKEKEQLFCNNLYSIKTYSCLFDYIFIPMVANDWLNTICFRNFLHYMSSQKIILTNPNCALKTEIVCDRSEPTVDITIVPSIAGKLNIYFDN